MYAAKAQAAKAAAQQQAQAASIAATVISQLQAAGLISKQVSGKVISQKIDQSIGQAQQNETEPIPFRVPSPTRTTTKAVVTRPMCRITSDRRRRTERLP